LKRSARILPLISKEVVVGALNIAYSKKRKISKQEIDILMFISRVFGSAIEKMTVKEEVKIVSKDDEF
jgi:LytS/YehU family sensor histidine kinase